MKYIVCPECGSTDIIIYEAGTCVYEVESSLRIDDKGRIVEEDAHFSYDDFEHTQQEISCAECGYVLSYSKAELKNMPLQLSDKPRKGNVADEEDEDG